MRVFKTRAFARFARRERIDDAALADAVSRAETRPDRRGPRRRRHQAARGSTWCRPLRRFPYELKDLRKAVRFYFGLSREDLETAVIAGTLMEIRDA